jgi:hypothetical protein
MARTYALLDAQVDVPETGSAALVNAVKFSAASDLLRSVTDEMAADKRSPKSES